MNGWALVTAVVASLLSGGLLGVLLKFKLDKAKLTKDERQELREEQRDDFRLILEIVTGQRDEALRRVVRMEERADALEFEVQGLRLSREIDPFPHWIIDLDGRYIFVNREFEKEFLEPRGLGYRDMIGERHDKIWPVDFAKKLETLDRAAKSRPDRRARAVVMVEGRKLTVHKFPICVKGMPVAFAGYITEIESGAAA